MSELRPETQALLELGRAGDDPSDAAVERNRSALAAKLGGAALGATLVASSSWASGKALLVGGALLLGGGALGVYTLGSQPPSLAPTSSQPKAPPSAAATRPAPSPAPSAVTSVAAPSSERNQLPRPVTSARLAAARSIQQELELIRGAQNHLHRSEARAALALLTEHARRFPAGALSEEREASRVLALCGLGDVAAARAQAERFLKRAPKSPFAERVRSSCVSAKR